MENIQNFFGTLSDIIWGLPLIILLMGTHLFFTIRLKFIQRYLPTMIKISFKSDDTDKGDVSQFGALATALAATIGTGNIVGVATAVASGGPGAVLWMWLTGVFGIATKYAESLLAVKYREVDENGTMSGGAMYVLEKGLKMKGIGVIFAAFTVFAAFAIGNITQANSISTMVANTFNIPTWVTGLTIMIITAVVILGGLKSIARVCEGLVPFMAIFYVVGCLIILIKNYHALPDTFLVIFNSAFSGQAAIGGFIGAGMKEAMRYGVARGLFSNESGLGSAPIVAAAAQTKNPVRQALVSASGTFWDTVVVCAMTGLVVVSAGDWTQGLNGAALTQSAFSHIPYIGPTVLTVGLLTFVFSTILGWSYYGEKAAEYLFGIRSIKPYRYLWVAMVFIGSVVPLKLVWTIGDVASGLMAIPNIFSLLALNGVIVATTQQYLWSGKLDEAGS
ncbi:sodium:alanine symporter family protein [bacterium]|nr:sodium:alanine symporter family protein [bacterium]